MVKVLTDEELDPATEEVNLAIDLAEEKAALPNWPSVTSTQQVPDLSDGGTVNGVRVMPMQNHVRQTKGRPTVRRAWMWNGTESMLPLSWNPEGTRHDGARRYLLKRHCLCCHSGGFLGVTCLKCVRTNCSKCAAGTDRKTEQQLGNGETIRGWIIPNFYLSRAQVPFPTRIYGSVNCFLEFCPRRDSMGFLTEQDMRIHARSRHRMEYQAFIEAQEANKHDELDSLRSQVASLMAAQVNGEKRGRKVATRKRTRK